MSVQLQSVSQRVENLKENCHSLRRRDLDKVITRHLKKEEPTRRSIGQHPEITIKD